jgi:amino acid transporter
MSPPACSAHFVLNNAPQDGSRPVTALRRALGVAEVVGLALAMIAPTMAMAFNTTLVVQAAGAAAPLTFFVGALAMGIVGLSFVAFSRRTASAGSAYAYVRSAFGNRFGFLAGWGLLLSYLTFAAGTAALIGNFAVAALDLIGFHSALTWLWIGLGGVLVAVWLSLRDVLVASRIMLVLEWISMAAILLLAIVIVTQVPGTVVPFRPAPAQGWSGIGYGLVLTITSFAGFEGAAVLAEEARHPHRAIPIGILATVGIAALFYIFVAYAQVIGFGLDHTADLARADAPLSMLSTRFIGPRFSIFINVAAAISAFSCTMGALAAAARILHVIGRDGLAPIFGVISRTHGVPSRAICGVGVLCVAGLLSGGLLAGPADYFGDAVTVGTLALILVYMSVTVAEMAIALRLNRYIYGAVGLAGLVLLLWPLGNSLYPIPDWPASLWPYVVVAWMAIGGVVTVILPDVMGAGEQPS